MVDSMENKIQKFTDLRVWQEGHSIAIEIYKLTKSFPKDELFALVNQMRRCAVSITSNIAEGFSRQSKKEKVQFYSISQGSLTELHNQLLIARDVGYMNQQLCDTLVGRLWNLNISMSALISRVKGNTSSSLPSTNYRLPTTLHTK